MFGKPLTNTDLMAKEPISSALPRENIQQLGNKLADMLACDMGMPFGFDNI